MFSCPDCPIQPLQLSKSAPREPSEAFLAWSWTLSPWGFVPLAGRLPLAYIPVPLLFRPQLGAFANGEERRGNLGRRDADAEARG